MYYKCALGATTPAHTVFILSQLMVSCIVYLTNKPDVYRCSISFCEGGVKYGRFRDD